MINENNINLDNMVKSQATVAKHLAGAKHFLSNCERCRAYIAEEKENWSSTDSIYHNLYSTEYWREHSHYIDQEHQALDIEVYLVFGNDSMQSSFKKWFDFYQDKFRQQTVGPINQ